MQPFEFDRTPEQKTAELARWDGIERRRSENASFRLEYERLFQITDYPRITDQELFRRCAIIQHNARMEPRHPETGIPYYKEDRYDLFKAFAMALIASSVFWGVVYLIIEGR